MTAHLPEKHEVDRIARDLHAEAVEQVSARTLYQLRTRRANAQIATPPVTRTFTRWALGTACAAVFAIAIALSPHLLAPESVDQAPLAGNTTDSNDSAYGEAIAALDEDPDFYLWLATTDVQPLAME